MNGEPGYYWIRVQNHRGHGRVVAKVGSMKQAIAVAKDVRQRPDTARVEVFRTFRVWANNYKRSA